MAASRFEQRLIPRFLRALFFLLALAVSGMVAALGMVYAHAIDWTMLGIGSMCLVPVLILVDILAVAAACTGSRRADDAEGQKACEELMTRMATLFLLHIVTAALGLFLLAVPASSVWVHGLTLVRFRATFLALLALSVLLSLQLPYTIVNILLPLVRKGRETGQDRS